MRVLNPGKPAAVAFELLKNPFVNVYRRTGVVSAVKFLQAHKLIAVLLALFGLCCKSSAADLVVSNNAIICIFGDSYMISDSSAGCVTGYRFTDYLESYFQMNYPGSNIHVFNISRSGGTMDDVLTNRIQALGLPLWAYQFNNYQHIGISQPTDNGSLSSNQMYLAQSNVFLAPALMSDGGTNLVPHAGWSSTNTIQWIALGDPPGASTNGGALTVKARNDASVNAGWNFGIRGVDSFNILSNGWVSDYNTNSARNVQMVYIPAEHFLSGGGLSWCLSFLRGITTDTNVSTATVDWNGSVVSSSHCVISGATQNGNVLTFQRRDDRLPMAWDVPDGTITNDARPAFVLNPADADLFKYTLQIRNLPAGMYSVLIDGTPVAILPDTALTAGWNMFTNTVGPIWEQRKEVLGRIRDKEHVNRATLAPRAVDGTGMFSYGSAISGKWGSPSFLRGDALVTSLAPNVSNIFSLDALTAQAAQPTNHTFTIMPFAPTAIVRASSLTNALNVPVILDGLSSIKATNYYWQQISGLPQLDMIGQDRARPMIISVTNPGTYTFQLTVSDGQTSSSSQIALTFIRSTGRSIYVDNQLPANCLNNNYSVANRNGSGSDGNAYTNLQWAASTVQPGDVVYIRGGVYTNVPTTAASQNLIMVTNAGTATAPIRFENYNNEHVTLAGWGYSDADTNNDGLADGPQNPGWRQILFLIPPGADYIQVKGLEMTNSENAGMAVEASFCYVQECSMRDNWTAGATISRMKASTATLRGTVFRWVEAAHNRHFTGLLMGLEDQTTFGFMRDCAMVECISDWNGYTDSGVEVLPIAGDPEGGGNSGGFWTTKYFADNAYYNPTFGVRNFGLNLYFVRCVSFNNCDDGFAFDHADSTIEDNRSLFNGPTGAMGYKMLRYIPNFTIRGNVAYGNLGRGFELRFDTNSYIKVFNNTSVKNVQYGYWIAGVDATSIAMESNNVSAFNLQTDWPNSFTPNWGADGNNVAAAYKGNPMLVNTNLALSSAYVPGWTVRQKRDYLEGQVRAALAPAVGSPLLNAAVFIPGYHCPTADNDPTSPMPFNAPGRHWKIPAPNMGAFDLLTTTGGLKPAPPTNLRSVTNF